MVEEEIVKKVADLILYLPRIVVAIGRQIIGPVFDLTVNLRNFMVRRKFIKDHAALFYIIAGNPSAEIPQHEAVAFCNKLYKYNRSASLIRAAQFEEVGILSIDDYAQEGLCWRLSKSAVRQLSRYINKPPEAVKDLQDF